MKGAMYIKIIMHVTKKPSKHSCNFKLCLYIYLLLCVLVLFFNLGKRRRDADFWDVRRDMDNANWAVLQWEQQQWDHYMQLLLESQAEEREVRRQELLFLHTVQEKPDGSKETFRTGFCLFLASLPSCRAKKPPHCSNCPTTGLPFTPPSFFYTCIFCVFVFCILIFLINK